MDFEDDSSEIQPFFDGLTFKLDGLDEQDQAYFSERVTEAGGQSVSTDFKGEVDYLVTPITGGSSGHQFKQHLSVFWLEDCLNQGGLLQAAYFHQVIQIDNELRPLEGVVVGVSGYDGREREFIKCLLESLGAFHQVVFAKRENKDKGTRGSTHLIYSGVGEMLQNAMYKAALKWEVPVINTDWLRACLREKKFVSESPFLVGDSAVFTPSKPMPKVVEKTETHNIKPNISQSKSNMNLDLMGKIVNDVVGEIETNNREQKEVIEKLQGVLNRLRSVQVKNEECFVNINESVDEILSSIKFLPTEPSFHTLPMEIKTHILSYLFCYDSGALMASSVCSEWREIFKKSILTELQLFENKKNPLESITLRNLKLIKKNQSRILHCILNKTRRLTLKQSEGGVMLDMEKLFRKLSTLSKDSKLLHLDLQNLEYDNDLSDVMGYALCNVFSLKIGPEFHISPDLMYRILFYICNRSIKTINMVFLDIDQHINWSIKISPGDLYILIDSMRGLEIRGTFTSEQVEAARLIPGVVASSARISKSWPVVVKEKHQTLKKHLTQ